MDNINNQTFEPVDGTMSVPVKEAGKILKQSGYKVTNKDVSSFVSLKDISPTLDSVPPPELVWMPYRQDRNQIYCP